MRITVIGGSGHVGAMVLPLLVEHHEVRVVDRRPPALPGVDYLPGDVTSAADMDRAVADRDALVYLAMPPVSEIADLALQIDVNVKGVALAMESAARAGISRVVHASSMSVFADYLERDYGSVDTVPDADTPYGLTKRLGEEVCAAASRRSGMSVIALRLTGPLSDDEWQAFDRPRTRDVMTAGSDVASAFLAALECRAEGFHAVTITGDHEERVLEVSSARELLGWQPRARRVGSR